MNNNHEITTRFHKLQIIISNVCNTLYAKNRKICIKEKNNRCIYLFIYKIIYIYIYIYICTKYKNYCFPNKLWRKGKKQATKFRISNFKLQTANFRQKILQVSGRN